MQLESEDDPAAGDGGADTTAGGSVGLCDGRPASVHWQVPSAVISEPQLQMLLMEVPARCPSCRQPVPPAINRISLSYSVTWVGTSAASASLTVSPGWVHQPHQPLLQCHLGGYINRISLSYSVTWVGTSAASASPTVSPGWVHQPHQPLLQCHLGGYINRISLSYSVTWVGTSTASVSPTVSPGWVHQPHQPLLQCHLGGYINRISLSYSVTWVGTSRMTRWWRYCTRIVITAGQKWVTVGRGAALTTCDGTQWSWGRDLHDFLFLFND